MRKNMCQKYVRPSISDRTRGFMIACLVLSACVTAAAAVGFAAKKLATRSGKPVPAQNIQHTR